MFMLGASGGSSLGVRWESSVHVEQLYAIKIMITVNLVGFNCIVMPLLLPWLHCPRRISTSPVALLHPAISWAIRLQLIIPIFMSFSASPFHLSLGLSFVDFRFNSASYIRFVFLASSNRCSCLIHQTRWSLMGSPRLASLCNFSVQL